ncbi:MAG: hypothetical protein O8C61_03820 [Candidatus Methanoperedens sp.]|nr:hypothetical protein [Candidatus Methanoperedens sp.]
MIPTRQYKCPNCKHSISIAMADFIRGIAMTSCSDCGRNAFAIDEVLLSG